MSATSFNNIWGVESTDGAVSSSAVVSGISSDIQTLTAAQTINTAGIATNKSNITTNTTDIGNEIFRALAAEATLRSDVSSNAATIITVATAVATEKARALGIENGLQSTITGYATTLSTNNIESVGTTLSIAAASTATLNLGNGNGVQVINFGTGSGATNINIGGPGDTISISGTLATVNTTNTSVSNKSMLLNAGGAVGSSGNSGLYFQDADTTSSFIRIGTNRNRIEMKPANGNLVSLNQSLLTTDNPSFGTVNANLNALTCTATIINGTTVSASTATISALMQSGSIQTGGINTSGITSTGNISAPNFIGNLTGTLTTTAITTPTVNVSTITGTSANLVITAPTKIDFQSPVNCTSNISTNSLNSTTYVSAPTISTNSVGSINGNQIITLADAGVKVANNGNLIASTSIAMGNSLVPTQIASLVYEKRDTALHYDNPSTAIATGEIQLFTDTTKPPVAYFGNTSAVAGNFVCADLFTAGTVGANAGADGQIHTKTVNTDIINLKKLVMNNPIVSNEMQGVYSTDPNNVARAPPSLAQTMIEVWWNGRKYALALYNCIQ
jgi:hypothetical protein